ncbi:MAG: hypothetical protein R3Y27_08020, partial [Clostridia bacterium]
LLVFYFSPRFLIIKLFSLKLLALGFPLRGRLICFCVVFCYRLKNDVMGKFYAVSLADNIRPYVEIFCYRWKIDITENPPPFFGRGNPSPTQKN